MKVLKRQKDKRPLKLVFTIESKEEEEDKVNKHGSEEIRNHDSKMVDRKMIINIQACG